MSCDGIWWSEDFSVSNNVESDLWLGSPTVLGALQGSQGEIIFSQTDRLHHFWARRVHGDILFVFLFLCWFSEWLENRGSINVWSSSSSYFSFSSSSFLLVWLLEGVGGCWCGGISSEAHRSHKPSSGWARHHTRRPSGWNWKVETLVNSLEIWHFLGTWLTMNPIGTEISSMAVIALTMGSVKLVSFWTI